MNGVVKSVYGACMKLKRLLISLGACALFLALSANAAVFAADGHVIYCPAHNDDGAMPDFSAPDCQTAPQWQVDPHGREIWMKASIDVSNDLLAGGAPIGIFVSAKASSEVYLNGRLVGRNGAPSVIREKEIPGRMDAVFYAPRDLVRSGGNDIVIRMSSHHGFIRLHSPVHWIAINEYADPTMLIMAAYWPSLIPFGALVAGVLYFFASSFSSGFRLNGLFLALMSLFAAGQLFAEAFRGFSAYAYPIHDWRLLLILVMSLGFGLTLIAHICEKFLRNRFRLAFSVAALATISSTFLAPGYDGKTALAVLTPAIIGSVITSLAAIRRQPQAIVYFGALSFFSATIILTPDRFLSIFFFYELAALLLVLFIVQALAFNKERSLREDEQIRSRQLALSLERALQSDSSSNITVKGAGKIDMFPSGDVVYCRGAGDYVEIFLKDGREILHNGSLAQLEQDLPATFLRVHRSYIVNTNFIRSLTRETSGVGQLLLTNNAAVPVSRRIMPKVRSALN